MFSILLISHNSNTIFGLFFKFWKLDRIPFILGSYFVKVWLCFHILKCKTIWQNSELPNSGYPKLVLQNCTNWPTGNLIKIYIWKLDILSFPGSGHFPNSNTIYYFNKFGEIGALVQKNFPKLFLIHQKLLVPLS